MVEGELEKAVAAVNIEFIADAQPMVFNGFGADVEKYGDLFCGSILGNEFEYTAFGDGQAV